jgi:hypothetical protein
LERTPGEYYSVYRTPITWQESLFESTIKGRDSIFSTSNFMQLKGFLSISVYSYKQSQSGVYVNYPTQDSHELPLTHDRHLPKQAINQRYFIKIINKKSPKYSIYYRID